MIRSIRNALTASNVFMFVLGGVCTLSILGTAIYHLYGWPQNSSAVTLLLLFSVFCAFQITRLIKQPSASPSTRYPLALQFACTFLLIGIVKYAVRHSATTWMGSPWQAVSLKFVALLLAAYGIVFFKHAKNRIHPLVMFGYTFFLFAFNSFIFREGFGFDIFVHEATISAWITHSRITPITILYNGFHALIAAIAHVTHAAPVQVMSWGVPFIYAALLTSMLFKTARTFSPRYSAILLGLFLGAFNPLWTTTTPQSLGHMLFFALMCEVWLHGQNVYARHWFVRCACAIGIAYIHPLSGIIACTAIAWLLFKNKFLRTGVWFAAAAAPATALIITSGGEFALRSLTVQDVFSLFYQNIFSFQPFVLTELGVHLTALVPLALLFLACVGYTSAKSEARDMLAFSSALIFSALIVRGIHIPNIIGYEQGAFATRLLFAAVLLWLPAAVAGADTLYARITRTHTRTIVSVALFLLAACGWYFSFPAWNTVVHTKSINITKEDEQIVSEIDTHAHGKPYVVLADQVTSAAALHAFGFFDRQLPGIDTYFYPIPTGGDLYTNYFLPATYMGVTRDMLEEVAVRSHVTDVFIVFKPYWEPTNAAIDSLKKNTTDWWSVGGTFIGHYALVVR